MNTNNDIVYLKKWFYMTKYVDDSGYLTHFCEILKETEKAYNVIAKNNGYGCVMWIPKSVTVATSEEREADEIAYEKKNAEYEANRQTRYEEACKAYSELISYAKAHGVKGVREGLRKDTIIRKIQEAGIALPA